MFGLLLYDRFRMTTRRFLDFVLYVVIALAIGLGIIWFAGHPNAIPRSPFLTEKWIVFAGMTLLVFIQTAQSNKDLFVYRWFWLTLIVLLIVHCVIFIWILNRVQRVGLWTFAVGAILERGVVEGIVERVHRAKLPSRSSSDEENAQGG